MATTTHAGGSTLLRPGLESGARPVKHQNRAVDRAVVPSSPRRRTGSDRSTGGVPVDDACPSVDDPPAWDGRHSPDDSLYEISSASSDSEVSSLCAAGNSPPQ
jgi:hypothetical protein